MIIQYANLLFVDSDKLTALSEYIEKRILLLYTKKCLKAYKICVISVI